MPGKWYLLNTKSVVAKIKVFTILHTSINFESNLGERKYTFGENVNFYLILSNFNINNPITVSNIFRTLNIEPFQNLEHIRIKLKLFFKKGFTFKSFYTIIV